MTTQTTRMPVETLALQNGSSLYFLPMPGAPRMACAIITYGGNRIDPAPGVTDIIDDLLSEGTETRSAEQIAIALDSLSLDMNTDTRRDFSLMSATLLPEDLDASMALMADMLYHSTLDAFEKEKIRLHGELVMDMDSPRNRAHDLLMTTLFDGTPYRASHTNILATLPTLTTVAPLRDHYQAVYHPRNMLFCIVGDGSADTFQTVIDSHFVRPGTERWQDTHAPTEALALKTPHYCTAPKDDSNQLHLYRGWFAPAADHPDYPAMAVLNTILGGAGLTSRLFLELRDKQGLAYSVRSQLEASRYTGLFSLYIGTEPHNRDKVLQGFDLECRKLMDTPVDARELADAQENLLGRRIVYLETAAQQCHYIATQLALGLTLDQMAELPERIRAVTSDEVQAAAQRYLNQPAVTAGVGPSAFL